ncbi:hypothetical protein BJF95_14610 [Rhizobium oryziradicis]|uniref:Uncharacterized protein n=1 Tax=Rhizobium oryziradicis TaxID=1867956 RepID=A0A1Q8ZV54_9HYPH|nr:hypothetical protein BJF95_14610 [Rhizobium oryziradicis]
MDRMTKSIVLFSADGHRVRLKIAKDGERIIPDALLDESASYRNEAGLLLPEKQTTRAFCHDCMWFEAPSPSGGAASLGRLLINLII